VVNSSVLNDHTLKGISPSRQSIYLPGCRFLPLSLQLFRCSSIRSQRVPGRSPLVEISRYL